MVKLLHTADWHLGKVLLGRSLLEDQRYFLEHVFYKALEEYRPDCVILAGDVFDRSVAPVEAVELLSEVVCRVSGEYRIPFCIISGNQMCIRDRRWTEQADKKHRPPLPVARASESRRLLVFPYEKVSHLLLLCGFLVLA